MDAQETGGPESIRDKGAGGGARLAAELIMGRSQTETELTGQATTMMGRQVAKLIPPEAYQAFCAGWQAGIRRRATQPLTSAVIEDIAALLESASAISGVTRPE
jgi:hypothetical protein